MYEGYFGFTEKPFSLTPDPKYLYRSESHADALELLKYAIDEREGFAVITGDIGTGKTTLCRALLEQTERATFTSLLLNPFLSEDDLLKCILRDFGVISREYRPGPGPSRQDLIDVLHRFLQSVVPLGARAVLLVDEAQNLPMSILEQIRSLSNLETSKQKLLQIILIGQRNLTPLLQSPALRQLDQRISLRYELQPLASGDEVTAYIGHRLAIAAGTRTPVFAASAIRRIHRHSSGIPRLINLLCDRSLILAYSSGRGDVDADIVRAAAVDLQLRPPSPSKPASWFGRMRYAMLGRPAHVMTA
jgi:general secretion pathway protein A